MEHVEKIKQAQRQQRYWQIPTAVVLIVFCTALHYGTDTHAVEFHNLYRRLYYLPILMLSFSHGLRGGVVGAVLSSLAYIPHAFFSDHRDPSPDVDKALELVLYLVVGGLTGWLVERQRRVQQALERALQERAGLERQLVRAGRMSALGRLTAGLAHEIRNPLASILGSAEALVTEFGPEHRKHRLSQLLLKEIHRLQGVVDDFLRFARPAPIDYRSVDLALLAQKVCDLTQPEAQRLGVTWVREVQPGEAVIQGDANQINQVLLNVILNALQALESEPGKQARHIGFIARPYALGTNHYLQFGVRDNGPGIQEQDFENIFDPYFTTRSEGTGLGLSISNRIIENHGGFMDIESKPQETTVWLAFPHQEKTA